jgi:hypothetical protein
VETAQEVVRCVRRADDGMERFEKQLERILRGVETGVLPGFDSRGCLDRASFGMFWKMDWETV